MLLRISNVAPLSVTFGLAKWKRLRDQWSQQFAWLGEGVSGVDGRIGVGCVCWNTAG